MLLLNPNYKMVLERLRKKERNCNELDRILKEPSTAPLRKKQLALFYFVRHQKETTR